MTFLFIFLSEPERNLTYASVRQDDDTQASPQSSHQSDDNDEEVVNDNDDDDDDEVVSVILLKKRCNFTVLKACHRNSTFTLTANKHIRAATNNYFDER